ncbi:carbohydrate ABC transporter permease [Microbacterium azadirachtae]|uniref:carbohydrate ABC transporter permease n=1 Tax=Microbacterium azadirachtae TaxID=582680 RepID=UPI0008893EBD|nr:sugar ABC transporter permease [Microbacterium azadirachtae]SDL59866.1 carbohydrate ABC transporter membrane protein 1, CUT1 family [Microbacterium azadirachtae]SEF88791.1 carbohydrate ABC transporter membrane protein 1, CUT1 family [Microbacterium azadirachtae]SEF90717.1 carbohydrate ABC transporter membrane protein 1, CUT1 family [Microbacterium azadirachtae]
MSSPQRGLRAFIWPAVLVYTLLFVVPAIYGAGVSLFDWNGLGTTAKFTGIDNYVFILSDDSFRQSFINTIVLAVAGGALVFFVAFCCMAVLRQMKGRGFIRSVVYLPNIISPIAIGAALSFALDSRGALNQVLSWIGLPPQSWLGPDLVFRCIIAGLAWSAAGFYVILLMSAVDAIPEDLYEAASLEGVTKLQAFRMITFPLSWDVFATCAVLWVIGSLKVFEIVLAFTGSANSGVPLAARTVAIQQYLAFNDPSGLPRLGVVSAIGVVMFLLSLILVGLTRRLTRRETLEL